MFTGLVEELASVEEVKSSGDRKAGLNMRLTVKAPLVAQDAELGDSIAVSGCCLTVIKKSRQLLTFEAGSETLSRTTFARLRAGDSVNLERSLVLGDRLGGHFVTGHIDGIAKVIRRRDEGEWADLTFKVSPRLTQQMAAKGSVAVDGVSLTLVEVATDHFSVALIPHTLTNTTLGGFRVGSQANVETDLLAKYVEQSLATRERRLSTGLA